MTYSHDAPPTASPPLLQLENCTIRFGGLTAVSGLNLQIGEHDLVGLIGPNGAGKTPCSISSPASISRRKATSVSTAIPSCGRKPYQITAHGIARTFQNIRLFPSLSGFRQRARGISTASAQRHRACALARAGLFARRKSRSRDKSWRCWKFFIWREFRDEPAKSLPYGDQRRLEIVRALATRPKLLLLDEPAAGMNPTEKVELMKLIQFVKDKYQIAVLLVEHDMQVVMGICQRIAVLDYGVKIAEGTPAEVRQDPRSSRPIWARNLKLNAPHASRSEI